MDGRGPTSSEVKLFASYQSLVTSYQSLVTTRQLLVTSYQLLVARYYSLFSSHQLLVTSYQSLVTSHQLLVTSHQLLLTRFQSLDTSHQLLATGQQETSNQLEVTSYYIVTGLKNLNSQRNYYISKIIKILICHKKINLLQKACSSNIFALMFYE